MFVLGDLGPRYIEMCSVFFVRQLLDTGAVPERPERMHRSRSRTKDTASGLQRDGVALEHRLVVIDRFQLNGLVLMV